MGQFTASGAVIAHYSYGLGLTNQVAAGTSFFYDYDAIGSTSGLTNQQGQYINTYEYLPFGSILKKSEAEPNPFQFDAIEGVESQLGGLRFTPHTFS